MYSLLLITLLLLVTDIKGDYDDYYEGDDEQYIYDEYEYVPDDQAYEEHQASSRVAQVPEFAVPGDELVSVDLGNTARLICDVDQLGSNMILWKRVQRVEEGFTQTFLIALDDKIIFKDRQIMVEMSADRYSSSLILPLILQSDTGEYICEVPTSPPIQKIFRVEIKSAALVHILDLPSSRAITLREGDPLSLHCQGEGDPVPRVYWSRENSRLPQNLKRIQSNRLEYDSVTRQHSGQYTCTGDNGFGQPYTQSVLVNVEHSPEVLLAELKEQNSNYELHCIVSGYPVPSMTWSSPQGQIPQSSVALVREGRDFILQIPVDSAKIFDEYRCTAENSEGAATAAIRITGRGNQEQTQESSGKDDPEKQVRKSPDPTASPAEISAQSRICGSFVIVSLLSILNHHTV